MLRVFAIQIQEHFRFETEWYRTGEVAGLVLQYYALLRSVLRTRPKLRRCLRRCRHCRIFFVADVRNAWRLLGCPFGCSDAHRKRQSRQTSQEYYQSDAGKRKKSTLNQRRKNKAPSSQRMMVLLVQNKIASFFLMGQPVDEVSQSCIVWILCRFPG